MIPEDSLLYLSDARGIYIPQAFFEQTFAHCITGVTDWARETCLAGPDAEGYWDAWSDVERTARVTDPSTGTVYVLYQDGDLWLVPENAEWPED